MKTDNRSRSLTSLEIVVVTSDRPSSLDTILLQLAESVFRNAKITVCDNGSATSAEAVCLQHAASLPGLTFMRYGKHIGVEAACLHAVESITAPYGWVLPDFFEYDFTSAQEVIEAIESGSYSVLHVGSRAAIGWNGDVSCDMSECIRSNSGTYYAFTVWPSLIFRSSYFDEECLVRGYRLVNNMFSNFAFVNALVENNAKVFISRCPIVLQEKEARVADFYSCAAWVNCCQSIKDRALRQIAIDAYITGDGVSVISCFLLDGDERSKKLWVALLDIVWGLPSPKRWHILLVSLLMLLRLPMALRKAVVRYADNA